MKRVLKLCLLTLFWISSLQGSELQWLHDYQKAIDLARKEQKELLLYFTGSDWCGWCMKLKKEILDNPNFIEKAHNRFICVEVDFPLYKNLSFDEVEQNHVLKEQNEINNFPTIVILDPKQRSVTNVGYMPVSPEQYADFLLMQVEQDQQITQLMEDFHPEKLNSGQLENYYKQAMQFNRKSEAECLLQAGLKSEESLYFEIEKYRLLVEKGCFNQPEAIAMRQNLLNKDPDNKNNLQFYIALTDFQIKAGQINPTTNLRDVTLPLINYLEHFGNSDPDNYWRVQMMLAQFYYDYAENNTAIEHAEIAYNKAPEALKPEIKRSMDYMRQHSTL